MFRRATASLVTLLGHLLLVATAPLALAQNGEDEGLDIRAPADDGFSILPRPGSGQSPETPGDPGGWQQLTLLAVIVVALALIATLAVRQARRSRAATGA